MSTFDNAIETLLDIEGGFNDDPNDAGGATNFGLSMRYLNSDSARFKQLLGITHDGDITAHDIKNITKSQAEDIYQSEWWNKFSFGRITDQEIATKAFCSSVNMGTINAIICLQRAVRAASGHILSEDGLMGDQTVLGINGCFPDWLLSSYKSELAGYYRIINNPNYIHGWLNRAYS